MADVTRILDALRDGEERAEDRLIEAVYDELRRLAAARLARESPGQTLQATALVHEVWMRLTGGTRSDWQSRGHFFGAAAEAMRRILIEKARSRKRLKRGGGRQRLALENVEPAVLPASIDLLALDEALGRFAAEDPAKAELVKLRYFAGLTLDQAAEALDISPGTADRWWAFAKAWLLTEMTPKES